MPGMSNSKKTAQTAGPPNYPPPGTVMLNPASQQLIDVRYTEVRRADMKRTLRTVGVLQMDDEKISRVHVKAAGWIDKMNLDGMAVSVLDDYVPTRLRRTEYLQLKATESIGHIRESFAAHPNIDVVTTREVFARIADLDKSELHQHVVDGHFLNGHLEGHVQAGIDGAEMTPEFEFPLIAFGIVALQSPKVYLEGKTSSKDAIRSGANRAWRALVCRAAAYASIIVSNETLVGLPKSVLTRLAFSRHDV